MKKKALFIFAYIISLTCEAMDLDIELPSVDNSNFLSDSERFITDDAGLMLSTLHIGLYQKQGNPADCLWMGTGFLWKKPSQSPANDGKVYLLTNKHVAGLECDHWSTPYIYPLASTCNLILKLHAGIRNQILGFIKVTIKDAESRWIPHLTPSDETYVDLCAMPMDPIFEKIDEKLSWTFSDAIPLDNWKIIYTPLSDFVQNKTQINQIPGFYIRERVFMIGYPNGFKDETHNLPVSREGAVSSVPKFNFNGRAEFMIDIKTINGSSGSPVLYEKDGHLYFIGIFYSDPGNFLAVKIPLLNDPNPSAADLAEYAQLVAQFRKFRPYVDDAIDLGFVIKSDRFSELMDIIP